MNTSTTSGVEPETLRRYAVEVAGIHLSDKELAAVAELLRNLLKEIHALDELELADVEPLHRLRLEKWS